MTDDLDRILDRTLSDEEDIVPSSGFTLSVMDAVRRDAAAPAPIPFPWLRALPGLGVAGLALALVVINGVRMSRGPAVAIVPAAWTPAMQTIVHILTSPMTRWTGFALVLTLVAATLPQRLLQWHWKL
jgi:hypothetical protein